MQMTAATGIKTAKHIKAIRTTMEFFQKEIWQNVKYLPQLLQ